MFLFHIEYTTDLFDFSASVLAKTEKDAIALVLRERNFEAIKSIRRESIYTPMFARNAGWRKGAIS